MHNVDFRFVGPELVFTPACLLLPLVCIFKRKARMKRHTNFRSIIHKPNTQPSFTSSSPSICSSLGTAMERSTVSASVVGGFIGKPRMVVQQLLCEPLPMGQGISVRRSIGRPELQSLDPILSFDELEFSQPGGFPDHPHRGFETVTYMLEGEFSYHDSSGHKGTISAGDVQWMTAGRGVVHAEMTSGDGVKRALHLWINLSSKDKMVAPRYQELASRDISHAEKDGVAVKVIAGEALGASSPVQTRTPAMCLDFTLQPGARLRQPIPAGWNACAYVVAGEGVFGREGGPAAAAHHCVVLGDGDSVGVWNRSTMALRFLLAAGQPLGEPVVRDGPFVMNTRAEIEEAREDYSAGRNGFEMARKWKSDHTAPLVH